MQHNNFLHLPQKEAQLSSETILLGSRTLTVSGRAREILSGLDQAHLDLGLVSQELSKLSRHLELARSNAEQAEKRLMRRGETLDRTRNSGDE